MRSEASMYLKDKIVVMKKKLIIFKKLIKIKENYSIEVYNAGDG